MSRGGLRVLYVAPYVPSPVRTRPWNVLRRLAARGYRITVVALEDGYATDADRAALAGFREAVHLIPHPVWRGALHALAAVPTRTPLSAAWCASPALARQVRSLASSGAFDVAHVEHLRAAAHVSGALGSLPRVLDAVDCLTDLFRQRRERDTGPLRTLLSGVEAARLRWAEPHYYRGFSRVAVTTEAEAEALGILAPELPLAVVPNGVDAEVFRPRADVAPEPGLLVFSGKLSYFANEDAAGYLLDEILPRVRRRIPEARLLLAGARPSRRLQERATRAGGVTLTGYVDDLAAELARAWAAVCPLRIAAGVQNKLLEALAVGVPVVAPARAARSLPDAPAGALRVADGPEALASACAEALERSPEERRRDGAAGRQYVCGRFGWDRAAEGFTELYASAQ